MDENGEIICEEMKFEDENEEDKVELLQEDQQNEEDDEDEGTVEYLDLDLEVETVPETVEYYPSSPVKSHKGRRSRKSLQEVKSPSQTSLLKSNYSSTAELKLRPKYRPIRPKPYLPNLGNRKLFGMSPAVNISALSPSSRFIVTTPLTCKEKNGRDITIQSSTKAGTKTSNGIAAVSSKGNFSDKIPVNPNQSQLSSPAKKDARGNKAQSKGNKGSVELFFESMAQTVMNLPMHIQAEIKMEICKLVTMAEIKYSSSSTLKQNHKNG